MKKFSPYDRKGVAERLKQLRRATRLTANEVAEKSGVSVSQITKLEIGGGNLGMDSLVKLADYYRVTKEWILTGDQPAAGPRELREPDPVYSLRRPAPEAIIKQMLDPELQESARIISERLKIPLERAWKIVLNENGKD